MTSVGGSIWQMITGSALRFSVSEKGYESTRTHIMPARLAEPSAASQQLLRLCRAVLYGLCAEQPRGMNAADTMLRAVHSLICH